MYGGQTGGRHGTDFTTHTHIPHTHTHTHTHIHTHPFPPSPIHQVYQEVVRLDEQELNSKYKIGVLYCKKGQTTEEEMYNNGETTQHKNTVSQWATSMVESTLLGRA